MNKSDVLVKIASFWTPAKAGVHSPLWKRGAGRDLIYSRKTNPPESPFEKGDLKTDLFHGSRTKQYHLVFRHLFIIAVLLLLLPASRVLAASAAGLVEKGNKAFSEKRMDDAITAYDQALEKAPDSAQILFNKGCALYMKGDYDKAADLFEQAAENSKDVPLEARSHFNLGNSVFRKSRAPSGSDPGNSAKDLERSISQYEKALELDPEMNAAGQNLEIARKTLKTLQEQIKKQEQREKEQQQQQQQLQDQLKNMADRQQQMAASTKKAGEQEPQPSNAAQNQQKANDQASLRKETGDLMDKLSKASGSEQKDDQNLRQKLQDAMDKQAGAEEDFKKSDLKTAAEKQQQAAESMKDALSEMEKQNEGKSPEKQQAAANGKQESDKEKEKSKNDAAMNAEDQKTPPPEGQVGTDDPEKILQEEQRHRQDQQSVDGQGYSPVEKDW